MTAPPVTERIANLGVGVRWDEMGPHWWSADGVRPLFGPFAGCAVDVWAGGNRGRGWHLRLWALPAAGAARARMAMAPEAEPRKSWRSAGEARAAAVRLLHGDADGLVWRPVDEVGGWPADDWQRGWRPVADLAAHLQGVV